MMEPEMDYLNLRGIGAFANHKISKVRWIPDEYETLSFFTGSWEHEENSIKVWTLEDVALTGRKHPYQKSKYPVDDDVTEIKFTDKNKVAVSTSNGDVTLLEVNMDDIQTPLKQLFKWEKLHNFGVEQCSCTSLDSLEGDVVSIGEDGNINILNGLQGGVMRCIKEADDCSLSSVCFHKYNEVITGNIRGHVKRWDLRSQGNKPASSFLLTGGKLAATCIINHPTQPHVILAGSEAGALTACDLRMKSSPTSFYYAHPLGIREIQFHPENPHKLLTCSRAGDIWCWNMECLTGSTKAPDNQSTALFPSPEETAMVKPLMINLQHPVNSFDCNKGTVLCGGDSEMVFLMNYFQY